MTVFTFKIQFNGDDIQDIQERYVLASTEEQAYDKIEEYRKGLVESGCADFTYWMYRVELDGVII